MVFFFILLTARGAVSLMTQVDVVLANGSRALEAERCLLTFHHVSGLEMAQGTILSSSKTPVVGPCCREGVSHLG